MKNKLMNIEKAFNELTELLNNHNEVFFIEADEYGYVYADGTECNESDFSVYSDSDKYGYYNQYAVRELKEGVLNLIGLGETEGELEILVNDLNYDELFKLAEFCQD